MFDWYIKVLKEYANFNGRATRSEFWYFTLVNIFVSLIFSVIGASIGFPFLSMIYSLVVLLPSIAVATRRLHDIGKSGWWQLLGFIPIIGWIVLIIWYATESKEDNQYGKKPILV
jgi:uncharacterized membrane protein YhaH (DUF805 family)